MPSLEFESNLFASKLISERAIDEPRPLKVIYIGAGVSGLVGAISLKKLVPSADLVIYEKNPEVGGTWYENRYPGCACDIPSHSYQLSFESSTEWSQFYATAPEILEYWKAVASKHEVQKLVKFQHKCVEARWDATESKWKVKLLKLDSAPEPELIEDTADVLITGTGTLNEWKWPDIQGLHDFQGTLLHSANWDTSFDATDKVVAVIGGGSSGIQIVPALAPKVKSMDHYIRGKTWISNQFSEVYVQERKAGVSNGNFTYSEEEKESWRRDPAAYVEYRKGLEMTVQGNFALSQQDNANHVSIKKSFEESMKTRLQENPAIIPHIVPDFPPLCKRLTPGPGYLEAVSSPKVNLVATGISRITATGIVDSDNNHREVDAIICATGFDTSVTAGFPIYGRDGLNLRSKYAAYPRTYLGMCTDGFPNFFQSLGPNSFQGAGSLLIMIEQMHLYVAQVLKRLATGNVKTIEPKRKAVDVFTKFCDEYFKRTVYTADCLSWYKDSKPGASTEERMRGRVTALWPGSSVHAVHALKEVRWEDFDMDYCDDNEFGWFGNGWTMADRKGDTEGLTWYLNGTDFVRNTA